MKSYNRNYSQGTKEILHILSGNECAFPGCRHTHVQQATGKSDSAKSCDICHIHSISPDGPRGKSELTEEYLNSQDNLILLCPYHHRIIDNQPDTYTAEKIKGWKRTHEAKLEIGISAHLESIQSDVSSHSHFLAELIDRKITDDVGILRKSQFFTEFDHVHTSLALGKRLVEKELSGGTDAVRSQALAWCARLLSRTEQLYKAEEYLNLAKSLENCPETGIADAFISSQKGDKSAALNTLADINTPASRSAGLMIVAYHEGAKKAVDWLRTAKVSVTNLDSDGKFFLLLKLLELCRWEVAKETLDEVSKQDLCESPLLHHIVGMTYLLNAVPMELRSVVLNQVPFNAAGFRLISDTALINTCQAAHHHFVEATKVAQRLNCPAIAAMDDEYALWLELKDPKNCDQGKRRLETKLRNLESGLRLVRLGLQFGLSVNLGAVEQEIQRQTSLHGEITPDAAIARFALAFTQETPEDRANYISRYFDELSKYINKKPMWMAQVEMFSQAGLSKKANECLELLLEEGLSENEESRLRRVIAEAEGADSVETRRVQFEKTNSLNDLISLVNELETKEEWDGLCKYGEILFEETPTVEDAQRLAKALMGLQKTGRLVEFIRTHTDFLDQSKDLRMIYCWALYYEGALLEARSEFKKLSNNQDNQNYRALQIHLGISLGDLGALSTFVTNEYSERSKRSARDLLDVAQLAFHLGLPYAKELISAAADKGHDDAKVLATAYFLATNAGQEDDVEVIEWLHRAVELSGDDGPLRRMSLQDILGQKPEWDRRESGIRKMLECGEIPMFLAAQSLNKSLVNLMLFPVLANLSENDPRRRDAISAYSGQRQRTQFDSFGEAVGMDAAALLTLGFLDLLDQVFEVLNVVYVPHATLAWLFEEKQRVMFHQPSRIKGAHKMRNLQATGVLEKFIPSTMADGDLSDQIGDELAMLIAEAEKDRDDDNTQHIVVRPSPVYRISSLLEEEADLVGHASVLGSCLSVVDTLRQKGHITAEEEKKARAYLRLHEKPWPHQPEITDGAILYLDSLAITYFLDLGILEKLKTAGFRLIASPEKILESDELISYESTSEEVKKVIERIILAIRSRIICGKIKIGRKIKSDRQHNVDELKVRSTFEHPTSEIFALTENCDTIIFDERFFNQHAHIEYGNAQARICSTLDLLDFLVSVRSISFADWLEYRTRLRRAGYFFIPVSEEELKVHLDDSTVKDAKVVATAELKAIQENILHIRMRDWLQLPKEEYWLDTTIYRFIQALKALWSDDADLSNAEVFSDWIMTLIDIRGWAHSFGSQSGDDLVKARWGKQVLMLLTPPFDTSQNVNAAYWKWVEDRFLAPIKEQYPDLYAWIVEWHLRHISETADMELNEGG